MVILIAFRVLGAQMAVVSERVAQVVKNSSRSEFVTERYDMCG
jgi:hypothetical protein